MQFFKCDCITAWMDIWTIDVYKLCKTLLYSPFSSQYLISQSTENIAENLRLCYVLRRYEMDDCLEMRLSLLKELTVYMCICVFLFI